jgi:hypothetical protein
MVDHYPAFSLLILLAYLYCTVHEYIVPNHVQTTSFDLVILNDSPRL